MRLRYLDSNLRRITATKTHSFSVWTSITGPSSMWRMYCLCLPVDLTRNHIKPVKESKL
jgi:hypothetical protein